MTSHFNFSPSDSLLDARAMRSDYAAAHVKHFATMASHGPLYNRIGPLSSFEKSKEKKTRCETHKRDKEEEKLNSS